MQKRALADYIFIYLLSAVVVISIAVVGVSSVNSVRDKTCKADLADFQLFFSHLGEAMRPGTVEEKSIGAPCGAERVFIMDSGHLPNAEWFASFPLLKDSVASATGKTVFLMKDDEVFYSFEAPNLRVRYPHFTCLLPGKGKISLRLEGLGGAVALDPSCGQKTCDEIPELFEAAKATRIFRQSDEADCPGCVDQEFSSLSEELARAKLLYENVEIYRKYSYCDGKMKVHLRFRPKEGVVAGDFRFFELIPKNCIENINEVLEGMDKPDDGITFVQPDPLLMWGFTALEGEREVSYGLDFILKDECVESIQGSGLAREVEKSGNVLEPIALTEDETRGGAVPQTGNEGQDAQKPELRITSEPQTHAKEDTPYVYKVEMSETGNILFTLTEAPKGMSITQAGDINWTPSRQGEEKVGIRAQHQDGRAATQEFTVLVTSTCTSHSKRRCYGGDAWWFDNCGAKEERVDNCLFRCKQGQCCIVC